jgi:hypothetical protein
MTIDDYKESIWQTHLPAELIYLHSGMHCSIGALCFVISRSRTAMDVIKMLRIHERPNYVKQAAK